MTSALLLGPGYPEGQLEIREEIKHLIEKGEGDDKEVIIMEQVYANTQIPLHDAFERLLDNKKPDFIVALYTKDGVHNAVDFELGTLTCHFETVKERLLILTHKDLDEKKITRYLTEGLYYRVINLNYVTPKEAADRIVKFMNSF